MGSDGACWTARNRRRHNPVGKRCLKMNVPRWQAHLTQDGADTELRLNITFGEDGNGQEEECSFTVVQSCSRFGKSRSSREWAVVLRKALRSAQDVCQDQRLDTKIPTFNRIEQIGNCRFRNRSQRIHRSLQPSGRNAPLSTDLGR